jgi:hypothetical protein
VLDTGALIAFERNDEKVCRLMELALEHGAVVHVPAPVVAQAWRDGRRQVRLGRLIGSGWLKIQALDTAEAKGTGALCGRRRADDIVDACVALLARRHDAAVVTSDPDDIRRLDPDLDIVAC